VALLNVVVAHLATDVAAKMAPATSPPVTTKAVPNPLKVVNHHGARFATWKAITLIGAGNTMIGTSMTPWRTLQKLSTLHALYLELKLQIGSWTQGLRPI
jgi:transposase